MAHRGAGPGLAFVAALLEHLASARAPAPTGVGGLCGWDLAGLNPARPSSSSVFGVDGEWQHVQALGRAEGLPGSAKAPAAREMWPARFQEASAKLAMHWAALGFRGGAGQGQFRWLTKQAFAERAAKEDMPVGPRSLVGKRVVSSLQQHRSRRLVEPRGCHCPDFHDRADPHWVHERRSERCGQTWWPPFRALLVAGTQIQRLCRNSARPRARQAGSHFIFSKYKRVQKSHACACVEAQAAAPPVTPTLPACPSGKRLPRAPPSLARGRRHHAQALTV